MSAAITRTAGKPHELPPVVITWQDEAHAIVTIAGATVCDITQGRHPSLATAIPFWAAASGLPDPHPLHIAWSWLPDVVSKTTFGEQRNLAGDIAVELWDAGHG